MTGSARRSTRKDRVKLSGYVRDQNAVGYIPQLSSYNIPQICSRPLPRIQERSDQLLIHTIRSQEQLSDDFHICDPALIAVTYSNSEKELDYLLQWLRDQGLIVFSAMGKAQILPDGHMRYEDLRGQQPASAQGFVTMWFHSSMRDAYEQGFEAGIRNAGYDPLRVDRVEHVGKIDDEIIAQIRGSRFVVADFTGHRAGVYFEAGFALGLALPVIWTCRKTDIDQLHFDIRQFNCIDWNEAGDLAERLQRRIEAIIGAGPRRAVS